MRKYWTKAILLVRPLMVAIFGAAIATIAICYPLKKRNQKGHRLPLWVIA